MRLTSEQISTTKAAAAEYFGADAAVLLFGSRTDVDARGGDIDLYIECPRPLRDAHLLSSRMNAALQLKFAVYENMWRYCADTLKVDVRLLPPMAQGA
jgi:predicted nucleotidyltransferase